MLRVLFNVYICCCSPAHGWQSLNVFKHLEFFYHIKMTSIISTTWTGLSELYKTLQALKTKLYVLYTTVHIKGEVIFETNFGHRSCCSTLFWDPKSKILLWCVAFSPGAWPHKASENLKIPKKGIKSANKNYLFNIFKSFTWNKKVSLFYWKAKNEERL